MDYDEGTPIEKMEQIEVNLSLCTLYRGQPHGLAMIDFKHPETDFFSFRGLGVFDSGKLHNGPFTCVNGGYYGFSFSAMQDGRPADSSYFTCFDELEIGEQVYSGQVNKEMRWNGQGKWWKDVESIYIGGFKNG